jgi:hypothetical protein
MWPLASILGDDGDEQNYDSDLAANRSDARLSDDLIDLMKDFSLSSSQAIGGAWGTPLPPPTPFDEPYALI